MCNRNMSLHQENTQKPLPGFLPSKHNQAWHNSASETSWIGHIQSGMAKDWQQSSDQISGPREMTQQKEELNRDTGTHKWKHTSTAQLHVYLSILLRYNFTQENTH